ncbi:MAG: carbohydrate kinase [Gammaproteobacteria bacterium]|nr:carbohydrate kinase [Gammaproteobacteria bacterium]
MKRPTIVSLGEVLWDLFPDGERFGGAPANFACHAAIQGADVTMVSAVGDDRNGHDAIGILSGYGIDVSLIQIIPDAPTGSVGVALDNNGKPTFTIHQGSAWDRLAWSDQLASRITTADAVYFGTLGQRAGDSRATIRRAVQAAAVARIPRILDINLRPPFFDSEMIRESVQLASILKLSDDELTEVCSTCGIRATDQPDAMLRDLLEFGNLDMVVMTRGANGAVLVTSDCTVNQNGIPANVIDTVGAGDSFTAAFLIGLLRGEPHQQNLHKACAIAAAACAHSGAVPGPQSNKKSRQR